MMRHKLIKTFGVKYELKVPSFLGSKNIPDGYLVSLCTDVPLPQKK